MPEWFPYWCFFINPGNSWIMLIHSYNSQLYTIFANKKMDKAQIEAIINNASEEFLDKFYETLLNEINSDDEVYHKKARHLLLASLKSEDPDDFFISLCGWSLESLIEKTT